MIADDKLYKDLEQFYHSKSFSPSFLEHIDKEMKLILQSAGCKSYEQLQRYCQNLNHLICMFEIEKLFPKP